MTDYAMIEGADEPLNIRDNTNLVDGANVSSVQGFSKSQVVAIAQNRLRSDLNINTIGAGIPALLGGVISNIGTAFQNALTGAANNLGDAFNNIFAASSQVKGQFSDMQKLLNDKYELLDGVRGYCQAVQTKNINIAWSFSGNKRVLPYTEALGPTKGAHIDADKNGIVFDEPGLWLVFCSARARNTIFPGDDEVSLFVDVFNPDGSLYSPMVYDAVGPGGTFTSVGGAFPIVVQNAGQFVRVSCWSGRWRWWDGGSRYARLAVVKQDNRTTNVPPQTVPDETE